MGERKEKIDLLNRELFIGDVVNLVNQLSNIKKGCCFAIEGSWGVGKTFVIEELEHEISLIEEENEERYFVFHYNCWQYDYYDEPSIAIISAMLESIREDESAINEKIDGSLESGWKFAANKLKDIAGICIENKIGVNLVSWYDEYQDIKNDNEKKSYEFDELFSFGKTINMVREKLKKIAEKRTVVIFVDELDRCIPKYTIKVLERLHHIFYGLNNIIVVLAIDRKQLEHSVVEMFGQYIGDESVMNVEKYLKKFIDFSLELDFGIVNKNFSNKYRSYFERFLFTNEEINRVNTIVSGLLMGIDIRRQEKMIQKAEIVHSIICNVKSDISLLLFEIVCEVYKIHKVLDMKYVIESCTKNINEIEEKIGYQKMIYLKDLEKQAWNSCTDYGNEIIYKEIKSDLLGKVFWYFANIYNIDEMPYKDVEKKMNIFETNIDLASKYCKYSELIK